jgi:hypothetical protein
MARVLASLLLAFLSLTASYGIVTFWPDGANPAQQIASNVVVR